MSTTQYLNTGTLLISVFCWQDRERREDELNELRHLLEKNQTAVTKWKTDAVEMDKVRVPDSVSYLARGTKRQHTRHNKNAVFHMEKQYQCWQKNV